MRRILVGTAALVVVALAAAAAWAGTITGTKSADTLRGTAGADRLFGQGGNDKLYGLAGNDVLVGGPGADVLACGPGKDTAIADAADHVGADCETVQGLPKPAISVAGGSLTEGNSGSQPLAFTVTLAKASSLKVTVSYGIAGGTATAGTDFTAASGTLVFAPGQTSKSIQVAIVGDTVSEPDETFTVTLSQPVNAVLGQASATGTIANDDPLPRAAHYAGRTSQGKPIAFDVAADLNSLTNLSFSVILICSGAAGTGIVPDFPISFGSEPWSFDASKNWGGQFSGEDPEFSGGGTISGSFDAAGNASGTLQVDGTLHTDDGDYTCSSRSVHWDAQ